jgi:hypothetical protein
LQINFDPLKIFHMDNRGRLECHTLLQLAQAFLHRKIKQNSILCDREKREFATFFGIHAKPAAGEQDLGLEDFDFLHSEKRGLRENSAPAQASVVRESAVKAAGTAGIGVAVIANITVIKVWTQRGITKDCLAFPFGLQRELARREMVRILQRKRKTLQTRICLSNWPRLPFFSVEAQKCSFLCPGSVSKWRRGRRSDCENGTRGSHHSSPTTGA